MIEAPKRMIHNLRANDFSLDEWNDMATFPTDGHIVEVRYGNETARAVWANGRIEIEPGAHFTEPPRQWREIRSGMVP